ncbi:MAG: glutamate racemase, partial [Sandaracinobacter sp.]
AARTVAVGPLTFIDGAAGIARRCAHLLGGVQWTSPRPQGLAICTGGTQGLAPLSHALHGFGLTRMEGL